MDALLLILFVLALISPLLCRLDWAGVIAGLGTCTAFLLAAPIYAGNLSDPDKTFVYWAFWITVVILGVNISIIIMRALGGRARKHPLGFDLEAD